MDELFGNLIYLIPIALVIFRVLSSITTGAKKKREAEEAQQRREAGRSQSPPERPVDSGEQLDPQMRELLKRFLGPESPAGRGEGSSFPAPPSSPGEIAQQRKISAPERQPVVPDRPAAPPKPVRNAALPHWEREKKTRPAAAKKPAAQSLVQLETEPIELSAIPPQTAAAPRIEAAPPLFQGLTPLQQGVIWAEILGPAKAMQE